MSQERYMMPPPYYPDPLSIFWSYLRFGMKMVIFALALLLLIYIIQPWFVITIKLKNGGWEVGVQKASIISLESSPKIITHEVQPGETLSGVASKYEVRQSDLQTWNGIVNPDQIFVGQRLQIRR